MRRGRRDHLLATVLFTDIVGSSEIAADLGDRRWRLLLARHHAVVRKALKRRGGKEIDNAGDGFFAAFDDQADAIRCGCEISDAVRELGVEIRAGLHVGQSEIVGKMSRINPAIDRVIATVEEVGGRSESYLASGIAPAPGSMWVAVPTTREVVRIDPTTNQVEERIPLPTSGIPFRLLAAFGRLWVTVS